MQGVISHARMYLAERYGANVDEIGARSTRTMRKAEKVGIKLIVNVKVNEILRGNVLKGRSVESGLEGIQVLRSTIGCSSGHSLQLLTITIIARLEEAENLTEKRRNILIL